MPRRLTLLVTVLCLALVAGCGGNDKKSDSKSTSASSRAPVSKAEYETRVVAALQPARGAASVANGLSRTNPPEKNARVFEQIRGIYQKAYDAISPIVPPKDIAGVHAQVATQFQRLALAATHARDALRKKDKASYAAALGDFKAQGLELQSVAKQLTARGY